MPDKKIGENFLIFKVSLDLYQLLQKNNVLFVSLVSENKQKILNGAFEEIVTCRKAIKTARIAIKYGWVVNDILFFVNPSREV